MQETQGDVSGTKVEPAQVTNTDTNVSDSSQEKVFKQSEVNSLIGREKHEAVERYKRKLSQESINSTENKTTYTPDSQTNRVVENIIPNASNYDQNELSRMIADSVQRSWNEQLEYAQRKAQEMEAQQTATDFMRKLETGKTKYDDYDSTVDVRDFASVPHIVKVANSFDNTSDIMYELAKNPEKIGVLMNLSNTPNLLYKALEKMSKAIKDNESAANYKSPREPLSQLKPRNTGTDSGKLEVKDYRKMLQKMHR